VPTPQCPCVVACHDVGAIRGIVVCSNVVERGFNTSTNVVFLYYEVYCMFLNNKYIKKEFVKCMSLILQITLKLLMILKVF